MNLLDRVNDLKLTDKISSILGEFLKENFTPNDITYIRKVLREKYKINFFQIFSPKFSGSIKCMAKIQKKMLIYNYEFYF